MMSLCWFFSLKYLTFLWLFFMLHFNKHKYFCDLMLLAICHNQKTYIIFSLSLDENCRLKLFDTVLIIKYENLFRSFYTIKRVYTKILLSCTKKKYFHSALVFCKFLVILFPEYQNNFASTFLSSLLHFPLVRSVKIVISIIKIRSNFIFFFSSASCSAIVFCLYYVYVCVSSITVFQVRII